MIAVSSERNFLISFRRDDRLARRPLGRGGKSGRGDVPPERNETKVEKRNTKQRAPGVITRSLARKESRRFLRTRGRVVFHLLLLPDDAHRVERASCNAHVGTLVERGSLVIGNLFVLLARMTSKPLANGRGARDPQR